MAHTLRVHTLRPPRMAVYTIARPKSPYHLQALAEKIAADMMEGKLASSAIISRWPWKGVVSGLYAGEERIPLVRRITGGSSARILGQGGYVAVVKATTSLEEAIELGMGLSRCMRGVYAMGATRIGRAELAPGLVELFIEEGRNVAEVLECIESTVSPKDVEFREAPEWGTLNDIAEAYAAIKWRMYAGASDTEHWSMVSRGEYYVRVAVDLHGMFITRARVDGVFYAAPPSEPFNVASMIEGMRADEQALQAVEARASAMMELAGIKVEDVVEAFRRALAAGSRRE